MTNIMIPASVRYIGGGAFSGCNSVTKVTVEKGDENRVKRLLLMSGYDLSYLTFETNEESLPVPDPYPSSENTCRGYRLSRSVVDDATITSMVVNGNTLIDSFKLTEGRAVDFVLRLVNVTDSDIKLRLPIEYTYETIGEVDPLTVPSHSTNMVTVTQVDARTFLVVRQPLRTIQP